MSGRQVSFTLAYQTYRNKDLQNSYQFYRKIIVSCSHEMRCEKLDDTLRRLGLNTEIENVCCYFSDRHMTAKAFHVI